MMRYKPSQQTFIGLLGYWRPFVPHQEHILRPSYTLVKKESRRDWGIDQQEAFLKAEMVVKCIDGGIDAKGEL